MKIEVGDRVRCQDGVEFFVGIVVAVGMPVGDDAGSDLPIVICGRYEGQDREATIPTFVEHNNVEHVLTQEIGG